MSAIRTFAVLLGIFLMSTGLAGAAAVPGPPPQQTDDKASGLSQVRSNLNFVELNKPLGESFGVLAEKNIKLTRSWTSKVRDVLGAEANALFIAILLPVLMAELTFVGFRILLRAPIGEQFVRLTTTTFILIAVHAVLSPSSLVGPTESGDTVIGPTIFNLASDQLKDAGRKIGGKIIQRCLSESSATKPELKNPTSTPGGLEPVSYWMAWIGSPPKINSEEKSPQNAPQEEYKFGLASLSLRVWGDANGAKPSTKIDFGNSTSQPPPENGAGDESFTSKIGKFATMGFLPFVVFGLVFGIAQFQMAAVVGIIFSYMAIMIATDVTLNLMLGFALILLPLIYFKSFEQVWSQVLTVVAGASLIGCMYYIFSAVGFVFTDNIYDGLFPLIKHDSEQSLGVVLNSIFGTSVMQLLTALTGARQDILADGITFFAQLAPLFFLGRIMFATTMLCVLIGAGVAFATMAPTVALRWRQGFALEETFGKVSESLLGVQSAAGSALGSMYSDAIGGTGRLFGGLGKGGMNTPGRK